MGLMRNKRALSLSFLTVLTVPKWCLALSSLGTNENTNGLLRQYFPKGTDLSQFTRAQIKKIQDELNDRPRKALGWYTPHEKFAELLH